MGYAGAGGGRDGEPFAGRKRPVKRVVGVGAIAGEAGRNRSGRALAEGHDAGLGALINAVTDRGGKQVVAQLGEALLHGLEGIGLETGEE